MTDIGLFELIESIKNELLRPQSDDIPLFAIGGVELELSFTVARGIKGGIDFKIVNAGGDTRSESVQHIKVTLEPLITPEELRKRLPASMYPRIEAHLMRGEEEE